MKALSAFAERVLGTVREQALLSAGDRVVVAVSGGPDSMALLEALVELGERLGLSLWVAHLDHGLRGPAAAADAEFVAARAAALGLPAKRGRADVAAERRRRGGSIELAARRVRYEFLGRVAAEVGATKVAVGHTADDQVETILEGLLRGRELRALAGMPASRTLEPGSGVRVVRPLIERTRPEVLGYLAERGAGFRTDESNEDVSFERNWIRHEVLPRLEERSGGGLREALLGLVGRARELADLVEAEGRRLVRRGEGELPKRKEAFTTDHTEDTDQKTGEKAERRGSQEWRLRVDEMASRPSLVRRAAVRHGFAGVAGAGELAWRAVDAVEELLAGGSGREVRLPGGVVARRSYGEIVLCREGRGRRPMGERVLTVPGRVEAPEVGLWVEAEVANDEWRMTHDEWEKGGRRMGDRGRWEEVVDLERVGTELVVRTRRAGDRFEPLGLGAAKKLKDFFVDERVPREERERMLVVEGRLGIVWVVGRRLDERAKVTPATRRVAVLRAGPLD